MNPRFRQRIASHNRHAVVAAGLSLLGAWVAWSIAYALFVGFILGFLTVVHGQEVITGERLMSFPAWVPFAALAAAFLLLVWGAVDERLKRFQPVDDRPVVGWHLPGEFLLLPARLTFGVANQLASIIRLSAAEQTEACSLLRHIHEEKRCLQHSLGAWFPDARQLQKLLLCLQLVGWIDLLHTEGGWIYIVRSTEEGEVAGILGDGEE